MRVLLIPLNPHIAEEHSDLLRAFNVDHEAHLYEDVTTAINFSPDIIFYQAGGCPLTELKEIKEYTSAGVVMWTGDHRYYPMQSLMDAKDIADLYLLPFTGATLQRHKMILGKPCTFHWEYIQDWRYREPKEMDSGRVIFIGNVSHSIPGGEDRTEMIDFLTERCPEFEAYGSTPESKGVVDVRETPDYYNDSYITIACNNFSDVEGYFTPRNLTGMSAGSCTLMKEFPGFKTFFGDAFSYKHKHELLDAIQFLQANPDVRNQYAREDYRISKLWNLEAWVNQFITKTDGIIRK